MKQWIWHIVLLIAMQSSLHAEVWNSPYSTKERQSNTLFSSFSVPLKKLDPVQSYNSIEWAILSQIYEPPLQYHYLKRPYVLEPLTLTSMPTVKYYDDEGREVPANASRVRYSEYQLKLREDIYYQDHPAFVKNVNGSLLYAHLSSEAVERIDRLEDFAKRATRRLVAGDYAYAIKRMAVRQNHSPILDTMMEYIVGLTAFSKNVTQLVKSQQNTWLDLRAYDLEGVKVVNDSELRIRLKGKYPQFKYWLSMNFFAPIPWEVDEFYAQEGFAAKNMTLNWLPVGTGAYYLAKNDPNKEMRLVANPHFHPEFYPTLSPKERQSALLDPEVLKDAGKRLPFIKEVVYTLEKESIPLWNKFLQGYYDASGVGAEAFDQAVQVSSAGQMGLSDTMRQKGISLRTSVLPSIFYMAFNMTDPVVGGYTQRAKKLRQAISIAQNQEEYISIFLNERGIPAQGPIPPGIFGYQEGKVGTDEVIYDWVDGKRVRKSLARAKQLLAEAGYPNGISQKTGKKLKLYYDATATGPDDRALLDWRRKQFAKLGIELVIRSTDYNRFQEKVRKGKVQLFSWGWNADYPDPENFFFLLYGANAVVRTNGAGINSSNYQNPRFDQLFDEMKSMENSPKRAKIIQKMLQIVREDAPWIWGVHPISLALFHTWNHNVVSHAMANNTLKYKRIDGALRIKRQEAWNQAALWPLFFFVCFVGVVAYLLVRLYHRRERSVIQRGER